jgi:serine/threonine protein kinase
MQQNNGEWLFGEYRVIRMLGKGGFGDFYLGQHPREKVPQTSPEDA